MEPSDLLARIHNWDHGPGHRSARLARSITAAIEAGRLPTGTRLPPERALATALEVSRGTVARTYERLRDDELVFTHHGAGTVVGDPATPTHPTTAQLLRSDSIVATVGQHDNSIDLRAAAWAADSFLNSLMQPTAPPVAFTDEGYHPAGLAELREALAARLTRSGLPTSAEQLVITTGAQQAIDTVLSTMTRPGDPVIVEDPSWPGIFELLSIRHLRPHTVPPTPQDHLPILRALRERRADLAYVVPSFHNPTGGVLAAPARRLVVEAAATGSVTLIDDLTMADLWIDEPPPPPLAAIAEHANIEATIITVGSLSKVFWGGFRLGWIRATDHTIRQLARVKAVLDLGTSIPGQLAALSALARYDEIASHRRLTLRTNHRVMIEALREQLPEWSFPTPAGGMSLWVDTGRPSVDGIVARARSAGVRIPPAAACTVSDHDLGHLRLTMTRPANDLVAAVSRLAEVVRTTSASTGLPHMQAPRVG